VTFTQYSVIENGNDCRRQPAQLWLYIEAERLQPSHTYLTNRRRL
jgi:hypothetical protein